MSGFLIVELLKHLLESRDDLKNALETAIKQANYPDQFSDLESFYDFIGKSVYQVPENSAAMLNTDLVYYYTLGLSPDKILLKDPEFQLWNRYYNMTWADFLNSEVSAGKLDSYINSPEFNIDDYDPGPSGWHTFNQFFARETKPGKRPIAGLHDHEVVVSPVDFLIYETETISPDSKVTVKGVTLPISELLQDPEYENAFAGGTYINGYLQLWDYHRIHTPVAGKVVEAKNIPGVVGIDLERENDMLVPTPGAGFQFTQDRGLIVIDSPEIGLIALVPVGMAQVSSVAFTASVGAELHKGESVGRFQFGGSCMVILTQKGRFELDESVLQKHVLQGASIGKAVQA